MNFQFSLPEVDGPLAKTRACQKGREQTRGQGVSPQFVLIARGARGISLVSGAERTVRNVDHAMGR